MSEVENLKRCPWCAERIRAEALKCRHCGSFVEATALRNLSAPWLRARRGRMIAGVCAGLAEQFGISVTILRLAFVVGVLFSGGVVLLLYIALWIAMPRESDAATRERSGFAPRGPAGELPKGSPPPPDADRA